MNTIFNILEDVEWFFIDIKSYKWIPLRVRWALMMGRGSWIGNNTIQINKGNLVEYYTIK